MSANPYEAPRSALADPVEVHDETGFLDTPRRVPASHGGKWVSAAWEMFKSTPAVWLLVALMYVGMLYGTRFVPYVGILGVTFLFPYFYGVLILLADGIRRGRGADLGAAMAALVPHMSALAVLGLVYIAISVVSAVVAYVPLMGLDSLGILIGRVPVVGKEFYIAAAIRWVILIPMGFLLHYSHNLVILHGRTPLQAMRTSFAACLRNIPAFLYFSMVLVGLVIGATLPLLLGWFVLLPVMLLINYVSYRDIFFAPSGNGAPQAAGNA